MMVEEEVAWVVKEFAGGRMQTSIGDELGYTYPTISQQIKRFCDRWSGVDVSALMAYGDDRRRYARIAIVNYSKQQTRIKRPAHYTSFYRDTQHAAALDEHAWLLRAEGYSLVQIGDRLGGVSRTRVRQRIYKFGKRMARAMRRTQVTFHHREGPARDWLMVATTKEFYSV